MKQFAEADLNQLEVFDELISDSIETHVKTKVIQRKKRDENKAVVLDGSGKEIWEEHFIPKLKFKKNVEEYNKFRKAKKELVKKLKLG